MPCSSLTSSSMEPLSSTSSGSASASAVSASPRDEGALIGSSSRNPELDSDSFPLPGAPQPFSLCRADCTWFGDRSCVDDAGACIFARPTSMAAFPWGEVSQCWNDEAEESARRAGATEPDDALPEGRKFSDNNGPTSE